MKGNPDVFSMNNL